MIDKTSQRLRLSLRQLEVFVATAHGGSSRVAAARVSRSQSAASSALAELESVLGVQLFDRLGRRLVLNENGRVLLAGASTLLEQAAEMQAQFSGEHAAPLRLAASLTIGEYLLPELLSQWKRTHARSTVHMLIGNTTQVISRVVEHAADVGFIEGAQTHPDLRVHPWLSDELVIVAAPGHALAGRIATHKQLSTAPWILRELGSGTRQATDNWLQRHLEVLNIEFELESIEAIKRLVMTGTGLTCLSRHAVATELAQGRLVVLRTRLPVARRHLTIVTRRDRRPGRITQDFITHCVG